MTVYRIRNFEESYVSIAVAGIRQQSVPTQKIVKGQIVSGTETVDVPAEKYSLRVPPSYSSSKPPTVGEVFVSEEDYEALCSNPTFLAWCDPSRSQGAVLNKAVLEVDKLPELPPGQELTKVVTDRKPVEED